MQNHRYILEPYKSLSDRYTCPNCQEKKKFTRYIDTQTNQQLGDHCGRCERSDSCGYHYIPSDYFKENPDHKPTDFEKWATVPAPPKLQTSFIDKLVFEKTLNGYDKNNFTKFLTSTFGVEVAKTVINKYKIGTTKNGSTIFYQVDLNGNVRSGKIISYNQIDSLTTYTKTDCKRDKNIMPSWVHKALKLEAFNLAQCFFGEHLLTDESKTVAVVESEKSAVIASIFQPQFTWIACGGKEGLGTSKIQVLKDRNVILFSDLNGFDKWSEKANEISLIAKSVVVSPLLEGIATDAEREKGLDIADYFLRYPAPGVKLSEPSQPALDNVGELFSYFLTNTKFLDYQGFTVDGINIDSLPFDVGFHLGVLSNPTDEQINEALQFVQDNQALFDTSLESRTAFRLGRNYGLINSNQEKEYAINILSIIKTQIEK